MKKKCKICGKIFIRLASHISRSHAITHKDYLVKYELGGAVPRCMCGCGKNVPYTSSSGYSFKSYILGHHANVRAPLSKEARASIGRKNSKNMKDYYKNNPEAAKLKGSQLRAGTTPESEIRRVETVIKTYQDMSEEKKQKFSDHTRSLWKNDREKMVKAQAKASKTWKERYENGEYDFAERNMKISNAITNLYLEGGQKWAKGKYVSKKSKKIYYYRSSWELLYMNVLDSDDAVLSWDYEPFSIPYSDGIKQRRYIPDFVVIKQNTKLLVEVKPTSLREHSVNLLKKEAAVKWCKNNGYEYREVSY
jgi:hypothetical protein